MAAILVCDTEEDAGSDSIDTLAENGDMTLVNAAKQGNREAFEILVERHQRRILATALRFTGIREDAEDIVQQSFQKAFVHLHKFEGKSAFSTWLTRIAMNEALMFLRRGRGLREISIDDSRGNEETSIELEISDSGPGPESSYSRREREEILSAAISKLNPGMRTAIKLRELGELSTRETARLMGLSVAAVKARVFHGRRKLRKALRRYVESAWQSRKQTLRASSSSKGMSRERFAFNAGD
jgi:RNA polymerase sigma-70 factor (ECF subfamily)